MLGDSFAPCWTPCLRLARGAEIYVKFIDIGCQPPSWTFVSGEVTCYLRDLTLRSYIQSRGFSCFFVMCCWPGISPSLCILAVKPTSVRICFIPMECWNFCALWNNHIPQTGSLCYTRGVPLIYCDIYIYICAMLPCPLGTNNFLDEREHMAVLSFQETHVFCRQHPASLLPRRHVGRIAAAYG